MKIGYFERIRCPEFSGKCIGKIEIRLPRAEKEHSFINDFYSLMGERVLEKATPYLINTGGGEIKITFSTPNDSTAENLLYIERKITVKQNGSEKTYLFTDKFDINKKIIVS